MSQLAKSLPPLHDVASLAGLELPQFLGKITPDAAHEINGKVLKNTHA